MGRVGRQVVSRSEAAAILVGAALCFLYAWTLDDAYIYYRYVDNAVLWGRGLVFNEGEFVEGFSSPLWTLLLVVARGAISALDALEIATYWNLHRFIGVGCFFVFAGLCVRVNRILSPPGARPAGAWNLPLVHLALNYSVLSYFSSGLETPLVLVSAGCYALYLLEPRSRLLALWIGVTPLVRHEFAVPLLLLLGFLRWRHGRFFWLPLASAALLGGSYLLFRVYYYADALPNTFYLKNIWWVSSGLWYLADTAAAYAIPLGVIAALGVFRIRSARPLRAQPFAAEVGMMLLLSVVVAAYVVKIGGDARHFRYLAFSYTLAVLAVGAGLLEQLQNQRGRRFAAAATAAVALATLCSHPLQLESHPLPQLVASLFGSEGSAPTRTQRFRSFTDGAFHRRAPIWGNHSDLERIPARLATSSAVYYSGDCLKIYRAYRADYVIHQAGLSDPFIARMQLRFRRPGHPIGHRELAEDLASIRRRFGKRGAFRRAVVAGVAPDWVVANLDALEAVEQKAYNSHDLVENLGLALRFIDDLPVPGQVLVK